MTKVLAKHVRAKDEGCICQKICPPRPTRGRVYRLIPFVGGGNMKEQKRKRLKRLKNEEERGKIKGKWKLKRENICGRGEN